MDLSSVMKRRVITQPVEGRGSLAGMQGVSPFPNATVSETVNEETDISIRKTIISQASLENGASASGLSDSMSSAMALDDEIVVDMQQSKQLHNCIRVRELGLLEKDLSINVRLGRSSCNAVDDPADLQILKEVEELPEKKKGYISYGDDSDVTQLLDEMPTQRGVICRAQQVLSCEDGMYIEGQQYRIIPGTQSKGAFGEAAMCEDLKTKKTFMRKTVKGKLSRNEIEVPLKFRGNMGIPEVYGVIMKDQDTEIFQEFAGMSLKVLMELGSDYSKQLCDPKMVMVLAFQAFATLHKLHSQGVTHQDIKPENLCLEIQSNGVWRLKFIDFGSSQTPKDQVIEGLTNEYLSPESCNTILQIATEKLPKAAGRLGPGTDVWALALSLLYCLCGYHVMVYVCTGQTRYLEQDPNKLQRLRTQCLITICNLKDEDILSKLIHPDWPEALKMLLFNTLRVDPNKRWSAKDAAEFILRNWILKGSGVGAQQRPASAVAHAAAPAVGPAAPSAVVFHGPVPPRLVVRTQPSFQTSSSQATERPNEVQAVQCTSPMSVSPPAFSPSPPSSLDVPSPMQLPDFTDLLSNSTTKKPQRRNRGKQRQGPYPQPARRGSKN